MEATGSDTITVEERRAILWLGVALGFVPILPLAVGAGLAWWMKGEPLDYLVALVTILYGAAVLLFLAGVRRGVSFHLRGIRAVLQILAMLALFGLGFSALVAAVMGKAVLALSLLIGGYAALAVLDPIAAREGQAPWFFARLRPLQMAIAIAGLAALLVLKLMSPY